MSTNQISHKRELMVYVIAVIFLIFMSGCTTSSGRGGGGGAGLEIVDYTIDPQEIYEDQGVDIYVTVRNVGSKDMPGDSYLWVYGPDFHRVWSMVGGDLQDAVDGRGLRIPTDQLLIGEQVELYGSAEYEGDVPQGTEKRYTFYTRLCYPYITTFTGSFYLISREEARAEKKEGKTYDILSSGPIAISFARKERVITARATKNVINYTGNPIRGVIHGEGDVKIGRVGVNINVEFETGEGGGKVPVVYLPFEIINKGDGFPTVPSRCTYGPDVDIEDRDKVAVNVEMNGRDITSMCGSENNRITMQIDEGGRRVTKTVAIVSLRGGKGRLSCKVKDIDFDVPQKQYDLEVNAYYEYYTTKEREVLVKSVEDIR